MGEDPIIYEKTQNTVTVTLNRPETINAFNRDLASALLHVTARLKKDTDARCAVIQGAGRGFCSGADLRERQTLTTEQIRVKRAMLLDAMRNLRDLPFPVIASCHGAAIAGGMELALACDIRVATRRSRWALPEVATAGAFPGALAPVILEKFLPSGMARLLVFTGAEIDGEEAHRVGIVDVLADEEDREAVARELAERITSSSPLGLARAKKLMVDSKDISMQQAEAYSVALRDPLDNTHDANEAVSAWIEGRKPIFRGN